MPRGGIALSWKSTSKPVMSGMTRSRKMTPDGPREPSAAPPRHAGASTTQTAPGQRSSGASADPLVSSMMRTVPLDLLERRAEPASSQS